MDATWHARPRGSATRRNVTCYLDIYRNYIGYSTYKHSIVGIYANSYIEHMLSTHPFLLIFSVWD